MSSRDCRAAIEKYETALRFDSGNIRALMRIAGAYECLQQHDKALGYYKNVIAKYDDFPIPYEAAARAYLEKGDLVSAREMFAELKSRAPQYSGVAGISGLLCIEEDRNTECLNIFAEATAKDNESVRLWIDWGDACEKLDEVDCAVEKYAKAADLDLTGHELRSVVYYKYGRSLYNTKNFPDAERYLKKAKLCSKDVQLNGWIDEILEAISK